LSFQFSVKSQTLVTENLKLKTENYLYSCFALARDSAILDWNARAARLQVSGLCAVTVNENRGYGSDSSNNFSPPDNSLPGNSYRRG
jgi:hypothetical protein